MTPHHLAKLAKLLKRAEIDADPKSFPPLRLEAFAL